MVSSTRQAETGRSNPGRVGGISLIEAVVAMVLVSVLVQGLVSITRKSSTTQGRLLQQEMAVSQMRSILMSDADVCTDAPTVSLPDGGIVVADVQGCDSTTSATIAGVVIADIPRPVSLSVTADSLGGQIVVGGTWAPTP